jgi:ribosome-binding factor A
MSRRTQRLNVQFREELSELILHELRDPRLHGMVSITRVDVSPDMENAEVYTSVLGEDEDKASTMHALTAAAPFLRRQLLERLRIRKIPALHFHLDESIAEAARILELMRKIEKGAG